MENRINAFPLSFLLKLEIKSKNEKHEKHDFLPIFDQYSEF